MANGSAKCKEGFLSSSFCILHSLHSPFSVFSTSYQRVENPNFDEDRVVAGRV